MCLAVDSYTKYRLPNLRYNFYNTNAVNLAVKMGVSLSLDLGVNQRSFLFWAAAPTEDKVL